MAVAVALAVTAGPTAAMAVPTAGPSTGQAVVARLRATAASETRPVVRARGSTQQVTLTVTLPQPATSVRVEALVNGTWRLLGRTTTVTWVPSHPGRHVLRVTYADATSRHVSTHAVMVWKNTAFTRRVTVVNGVTAVSGITVVNKGFRVPSTYAPGRNDVAEAAFVAMQRAARADGIALGYSSAYRSYAVQTQLFWGYVAQWGQSVAETYSARPGHSEHQTGKAYDLTGKGVRVAGGTATDVWLRANAYRFGFILRYPSGKASVTGYRFEPWHYRYVGVSNAALIRGSGVTLDEYLAVVHPTYG